MSYTLNYTGSDIDDILDRAAPGGAIDQALAAKQDTLTFDAVPTQGSTNPAESGGIYDAIQAGGATALAAFATDSVTPGDIVSFSDGADGIPVKSFVGSILPVQDLHGYDNPWPAGGGANKWDEVAEAGGINDTTGQNATASGQFRSVNYIPVNPSTDYYVCYGGTVSSHNIYVYFYASDQSFIGRASISGAYNVANKTITTPSNCAYIRLKAQITGESTYANNIAINYPSTVTTYSPYSNICPISGWSGAEIYRRGINLWDEAWEVGSINQETGANSTASNVIRAKNICACQPGMALYLGTNVSAIYWYGANDAYIGFEYNNATGNIRTAPANAKGFRILVKSSYGATYNHDISINYPSTDTTYHAYNGQTILLSFGSTVYAGTLTALGGGMWEVQPTHKIDSLDSHTWNYGGNNRFNATGFSDMKQDGLRSEYIYCSCYAPNVGGGAYDPFTIYNGTGGYLYVVDDRTTDGATLKTLLAGQKMVYPLATLPSPITITGEDLQTLLGANTVWLNCGSVTELEYRADTALYVQKLIGGGTLQALSMASPSPSLSLGRVGVLAEPEAEAVPEPDDAEPEAEETAEEPEQTEEAEEE